MANPVQLEKIRKWHTKLVKIRNRLEPYTHCAKNGPSTTVDQAIIAKHILEAIDVLLDMLDEINSPTQPTQSNTCQCGHLKEEHIDGDKHCINMLDCDCRKYTPLAQPNIPRTYNDLINCACKD